VEGEEKRNEREKGKGGIGGKGKTDKYRGPLLLWNIDTPPLATRTN